MLGKFPRVVAGRAVLLIHGALFAWACASADIPRSSTETTSGDSQYQGDGGAFPPGSIGTGGQVRGRGGAHDSTANGGAQGGFGAPPPTGGAPDAGQSVAAGSGIPQLGAGASAGSGGYQDTGAHPNTGGRASTGGNSGRASTGGNSGSVSAGGNSGSVSAGGNSGSARAGALHQGGTSGTASAGTASTGSVGGSRAGSLGGSGGARAGGAVAAGGANGGAALQWRKANLTNYESYPAPDSEECIEYNGCTWAGQFAALDGVQSESWVKANDIIAVHEKDFAKYKLKTLRLRTGSQQIDAKVYDMCSDSDCDGCCTANSKETGFLIDIEKYSMQRFGVGDGIVEWACLDCN